MECEIVGSKPLGAGANIYVHTDNKSTCFSMSSSSNGTSTPCKSKAEGKVEG